MTGFDRRHFLKLAGATLLSGCSGNKVRPPSKARVVVVGGGYGGATAAKYLKLLEPTLDVILVEKQHGYLSCPGSNEVLAGWHELDWLRRSHAGLETTHAIRVVHALVDAIDDTRRSLHLADGVTLSYDRLILSPGIVMRWDAIEGYDEQTSTRLPHAWQAGKQTLLLREQVRAMNDGGVVLITSPANPYRCPPGPYERASLIAHYLKRHKPRSKVIILDAKTQFSKQALFQRGWQALYPSMIEWISAEKEGRIERVDEKELTVHTEFNEHRADVLNIIPPQKAGWLAESAGLTDASGWCPVHPVSFESRLRGGIHVIGDACIATPMPKSAFSANSQAKVCAAAVVDLLAGREPGLPSLINHCYSLLAPDYAISIDGVYEYSEQENQLVTTGGGETPMDADRRQEAEFAHSGLQNISTDSFQ